MGIKFQKQRLKIIYLRKPKEPKETKRGQLWNLIPTYANNYFSRIIHYSHKFSGKSIEGYNYEHDENKKKDDFKDILATPNDKKKLTCNEYDFTILQN